MWTYYCTRSKNIETSWLWLFTIYFNNPEIFVGMYMERSFSVAQRKTFQDKRNFLKGSPKFPYFPDIRTIYFFLLVAGLSPTFTRRCGYSARFQAYRVNSDKSPQNFQWKFDIPFTKIVNRPVCSQMVNETMFFTVPMHHFKNINSPRYWSSYY